MFSGSWWNFPKTQLEYSLLWFCLVERQWLTFAIFVCHHLQQASVVLLIILLYGLEAKQKHITNTDKWYRVLKHDY